MSLYDRAMARPDVGPESLVGEAPATTSKLNKIALGLVAGCLVIAGIYAYGPEARRQARRDKAIKEFYKYPGYGNPQRYV